MSNELGVDRVTLKEIAKAHDLKFIEKDGMKFYSIFEMQKILKDTIVAIYRPVYITEIYHIYESKMNYETE